MEKVAGIVAEYNPFHHGHAHHIRRTRAALGADCGVVCVLSGDFVQRGENAVFDKFSRAETAVRGGADLVLELPICWALASAEGFARGGVHLLAKTGVVTHLSFGSESGDLAALRRVSDAMAAPDYAARLHAALETGVSYAAARTQALGGRSEAALLTQPNDLLGIEYLNAVRALAPALAPLAVCRVGARHDSAGEGEYPSASRLRTLLRDGADVSAYVPALPQTPPLFPADLEIAVLSRLRMLSAADFAALPGVSEGLENVLWRAARTASTLEEFHNAAKSRRYPMSRIRRLTLSAALGLGGNLSGALPSYLRVLAANERGRSLLHEMRKTAALPVITKPAAAKDLPEAARAVFERTADAHDLYVLGYADPALRRPGGDWRATPRML